MKVLLATAGGAGRTTLAIMRSLHRAGAELTIGGNRFRGEAVRSKVPHRRLRYPSPAREPAAFRAALLAQLRHERFDLLLPVADYTNLAISDVRCEVESEVRLARANEAAIARCHDKLQTLALARSLGIAVPETHAPAGRESLDALAAEMAYPCVLKPRSGAGSRHTYFVESADELRKRFDGFPGFADLVYDDRPLLQSYVPGTVHEVCALFCRGEPRALLTQARLGMRPAKGGPGIDNVTTHDPELAGLAVRLLESLDWHGPAQVEFKRDARDGTPVLLEINPRFWGTLDLAIRAGIDFPKLTAQLAMEGDVAACFEYREGLRYRWLQPSNGWSFWNVLRPSRSEVSDFRWDDPGPQFYLLRQWLRRKRR